MSVNIHNQRTTASELVPNMDQIFVAGFKFGIILKRPYGVGPIIIGMDTNWCIQIVF